MKSLAALTIACVAVALTTPAQASIVSYVEADFGNARDTFNRTHVNYRYPSGNAGSSVVNGRTQDIRIEVDHTLSAPNIGGGAPPEDQRSRLVTSTLFTAVAHDLSTAPLDQITFLIDLFNSTSMTVYAMLGQDGDRYRCAAFPRNPTSLTFTAADCGLVTGASHMDYVDESKRPDLSPSGSPLSFGILFDSTSGDYSGGQQLGLTATVDQFGVNATIDTSEIPLSGGLGFALLGYAVLLRRR